MDKFISYIGDQNRKYWIEDDVVFGPRNLGKFWINDGYIYGPSEGGNYWIDRGRICRRFFPSRSCWGFRVKS